MPSNNAKESLRQFISVRPLFFSFSYGQFIPNSVNPQRDPNAHYVFDSERDASQSEICRQSKNKECMIVRLSVHENHQPNRGLVDTFFWGKKASDDIQGIVCSDAGSCFPSVIILHGPYSGLLRCILSPWCHGVDSDRVVVV